MGCLVRSTLRQSNTRNLYILDNTKWRALYRAGNDSGCFSSNPSHVAAAIAEAAIMRLAGSISSCIASIRRYHPNLGLEHIMFRSGGSANAFFVGYCPLSITLSALRHGGKESWISTPLKHLDREWLCRCRSSSELVRYSRFSMAQPRKVGAAPS